MKYRSIKILETKNSIRNKGAIKKQGKNVLALLLFLSFPMLDAHTSPYSFPVFPYYIMMKKICQPSFVFFVFVFPACFLKPLA